MSLHKDGQGRPRGELWHVNGHWELRCACGQAKTMRRATKRPDGEAVARLEGWCPNCGHVSLTAGEWRIANKPHRGLRAIRKALDGEGDGRWAIGNPLTFNDPLSARYGSARSPKRLGGSAGRRKKLTRLPPAGVAEAGVRAQNGLTAGGRRRWRPS